MFANAPAKVRDAHFMNMLYQFAATYALKRPVALNVRINKRVPRDVNELADMCLKFDILELYNWLSMRFPTYFVEKDVCSEQKARVIQIIQSSLVNSLSQRYSHSSQYLRLKNKAQKSGLTLVMAISTLNKEECKQKQTNKQKKQIYENTNQKRYCNLLHL